jgi:hypothetical protein
MGQEKILEQDMHHHLKGVLKDWFLNLQHHHQIHQHQMVESLLHLLHHHLQPDIQVHLNQNLHPL